jgi:hypothetical protein
LGGVIAGSVKSGGTSPAATPANGTTTNSEIGSKFRTGVYAGTDFSLYAQVVQGNGSYGVQLAYGGAPAYWIFSQSGVATGGVSWTPTCDERLKDWTTPEPLEKCSYARAIMALEN